MKAIRLGRTVLGAGRPALAVPVVARTKGKILERARQIAEFGADLMEWRCDFYDDRQNPAAVRSLLEALRGVLGGIPLLFTFRTVVQGGNAELPPEEYAALCELAAGLADAVDVEMLTDEAAAGRALAAVHAAGGVVVGSHHDFKRTPPKDEMLRIMRRMLELGADIPKLAVTPQSKRDVLALLEATLEMSEQYGGPIITMSMTAPGVISRISGEVFGSALTFGSLGESSAPGQIPAERLRTALEIVHRALTE